MKKKIVSLILILVLCVSVLSGCVLFEKSNKNDYAQVVARIRNVQIGTEEKPETFSKDITKRDLVLAYINFGQSSTEGMGIQAALDSVLDQLIKKELVLARYQKLLNNGDAVLTEAQKAQDYNKAWKAVYDYCDQQITSYENQIYANKGLAAPQAGEAAGEPQYPLNKLVVKTEEDINKDSDEAHIPEPFTPDPVNIPKSTDANRLSAVKSFIIAMIQQFNDIKLTKAEEALLKADKDFINDNDNKTLIYEKIMGNGSIGADATGFFCIRRLIAESQFQQSRYERAQEYYNDWIKVTDADVEKYYSETLEDQMLKFSKLNSGYLNTYYEAAKDTSANPFIFYHPTDEVFYVKHILVPFSDAQKADIEKYKNGKTNAEVTAYRDGLAPNIESYQHYNGYDDLSKGLFSMQYIYNDVAQSMAKTKNNWHGSEWAFNSLIFKYNTDTGIFNNELGYIMPPKGQGIESGYMAEFARAAYKLYENGKPGDFLNEWAITDYGVHLMYYSSNTGRFVSGSEKGVVTLSDWTSPLRTQTYARAVKDYLLDLRQNQNFAFVQNQIAAEFKNDETYVKIYEGRYADLWKSAQKAAEAAEAANPSLADSDTQGQIA